MRVDHILDISEVIIEQNINSKRLYDYFIFPKFETSASNLKFTTYIRMLRLLIKLGYKEDEIFWKNHILEAIKTFHLNLENANTLKTTLLIIEKNLGVDVEIYLKKIEEIIKALKEINEKDDIMGIKKNRTIFFNMESDSTKAKDSKMYKNELKQIKQSLKGNLKGTKMTFEEITNALKKSVEEKKSVDQTLQEYELKRKTKDETNKKDKKIKNSKNKDNDTANLDKEAENTFGKDSRNVSSNIKKEVFNNKI